MNIQIHPNHRLDAFNSGSAQLVKGLRPLSAKPVSLVGPHSFVGEAKLFRKSSGKVGGPYLHMIKQAAK